MPSGYHDAGARGMTASEVERVFDDEMRTDNGGLSQRFFQFVQDKRVRRAVLLVSLWLPVVAFLLVVREVLRPFLLAIFLAYVITPPVRWLSSRQVGGRTIPRWAATLVLYIGAALVLSIGGRIVVPQLYREVTRAAGESSALLDELSDERLNARAKKLGDVIESYNLPVHIVDDDDVLTPAQARRSRAIELNLQRIMQDALRDAKAFVAGQATHIVQQLQAAVTWTVQFIFSTFLVLMLTAFLVADAERIVSWLLTLTPIRDRGRFGRLLTRVDSGLSGVVRGQLTICVVNGVLTLVGLLLLKVKFAFLLATLASVFSLVPIFGSILSTIPIVVVALSNGLTTALLSVGWIVGIHALEANVLNPKIMGDAAKVHPVLVVLALVVGEHWWGIVGALFAVPIMSIAATIYKAAHSRAIELDAEIHATGIDDLLAAPMQAPSSAVPPPRRAHVRLRRTQGG